MFVADNIYDLTIDLVLPHVCFLGINQDKSSTLDPNGVAETRWELDENSLLIRQRARVEAVPFRLDDTRNGLGV